MHTMITCRIFCLKEYWNLIEQGIPTTETGAELTEGQKKMIEDAKLKDFKVKNYLFQTIDQSVLETILNKDTTKRIRVLRYLKNTLLHGLLIRHCSTSTRSTCILICA